MRFGQEGSICTSCQLPLIRVESTLTSSEVKFTKSGVKFKMIPSQILARKGLANIGSNDPILIAHGAFS